MLQRVGIPKPDRLIDEYPFRLSGGNAPARYDCDGPVMQSDHA